MVILHLSDLHFGPHSRFGRMRPQALADMFGRAIERHRLEAGLGKIDLVVVSGDLTEYADDEQFELARQFCEALNGHFGLGRERWAFVPGNHDLSRAWIELARVQQKIEKFDDEELERRIHEYKFRNYSNFLARFYDGFEDELRCVALSPAGWVRDIPELRVSLGLINSSETTTERAKAGKLGSEQAQAFLDHWKSHGDERLRLLVVHHNPQEVDDGSRREAVERLHAQALGLDALEHFIADTFGLEGKELLERVAKQGRVPLLLHGHVHATPRRTWEWDDGEGRTHVLAAGSAGAASSELPRDQPNSVQLVAIDLADGGARVLRLRYEPRAEEPGHIELGTFVREVDELGGTRQMRLSLPGAFMAARENPTRVAAARDDVTRGFLKEYRARLSGRFETWDFGTRQRGTRQPAVVTLDEMYVPLRIDAGHDQAEFKAGRPLDVDDVLARERGLVVRGIPGAGKTTWLRWLFRRMVEREDVLPIFVELRALAFRWAKLAPTEPHSLEGFLSVWLAEWVGAGWDEPFRAALDRASPRPVLLIDGWDELGDLGRELGPQLVGLAQARPHVRIVTTSRPYGEGISELAVRFDELQIQPMSDGEIACFVRNFYGRVHRSEAQRLGEQVDRFLMNLASNPQARSLGRTPLLLVLLLIIGRDRPLPDRRHELYRICIEELLDARPKQRQAFGALQGSWEWAPEQFGERLQAVARLAVNMQSRQHVFHPHHTISAALGTREQLCAELGHWEPHQRDEFVTWLVGGTGLLIEREDGQLQFAHLGLQEYLAAWHLDVTNEGLVVRLLAFAQYGTNFAWWEVLRLWAALVEGRSTEHLAGIANGLMQSGDGFWLVGAMLADGLGERAFDRWLSALGSRFDVSEHFARSTAAAWKASQQHDRRSRIAGRLAAEVSRWTWTQWQRADRWRQAAGIVEPLPCAPTGTPSGWVMRAWQESPLASERHFAWGRVWMSTSPFWGGGVEQRGLRLWPTRRSWIGWMIQSAIACGMSKKQVLGAPWHRLLREPDDVEAVATSIAMSVAKIFTMRILVSDAIHKIWPTMRCISMEIARSRAMDVTRSFWMSTPKGGMVEYSLDMSIAVDFAGDLLLAAQLGDANHVVHPMMTERFEMFHPTGLYAKQLAPSIAKVLQVDSAAASTQDFTMWLSYSSGFAGTRTVFANAKETDPLTELLGAACRHSFDPSLGAFPSITFSGDPLWPALARHVARCSTPSDRAQLEALARNPERAPEPLRWGLRYTVRGDVVFEDGSVMTLDELWAHLRKKFRAESGRLANLPLLEDMPRDLDHATLDAVLDQ